MTDQTALARHVLELARARGWMIATAESCTGGLVAAALTDIPGSSDVFDRGFLTYSYPAKEAMLGVDHDTLHDNGAVSEPVARQMAEGARARSDAQLTIAITGVAGPGGSDDKPEGLVHFATSTASTTVHREVSFGPLGRANVRAESVRVALEMLREALA
ncbi:MAG: CinA family protein [Pseudomonadota bacterium]